MIHLQKIIHTHPFFTYFLLNHHHSNIIPSHQPPKPTPTTFKYIPLHQHPTLSLQHLNQTITHQTKILPLTHLSNLLPTINPIKDIP
ncbi:aminotransferase class V-fold PLP-dependent enzyme, partial [Bacillus pumilus]|uniref:aminotransferase class V-fold PLP-dependent enzyme n=1 Tax=Bacillus pumilus TaxID=1408 RepID=UPI0011A6077B